MQQTFDFLEGPVWGKPVVDGAVMCKVCGAGFITFPLCSNGCCVACHAVHCDPKRHTLDLEKARARDRGRIVREKASSFPSDSDTGAA